MYVSGAFSCAGSGGKMRVRGGCGVYWPKSESNNLAQQIDFDFLTPHRCHLQGIILALQTAVDRGYKKIIVRTNFDSFKVLNYSLRKQTDSQQLSSGTDSYFYKRIYALERKLVDVKYEFTDSNEEGMKQAILLAENGLNVPKISEV